MLKLKSIFAAALVFAVLICLAFRADRSTAVNKNPEPAAVAKPTEKAPLWINEAKFVSETTIASKSKLETGRAPVDVLISPIGRLTLAKNSSGVLTYDQQTAHVALQSGCALLYLETGRIGTIETLDSKKVLCSTKGCQVIEMCADREVGGFLLWSALGAPAAGIAAAGFINTDKGEIASASRISDIVR